MEIKREKEKVINNMYDRMAMLIFEILNFAMHSV